MATKCLAVITHSHGRQVLKMKFQLCFFLAHTSSTAFPRSAPFGIFSHCNRSPRRSGYGHLFIFLGSIWESLGAMWEPLKWGQKLIRERCAPLEIQHMFGSQCPYLLCLTLLNIPVPYMTPLHTHTHTSTH